MTSDTFSTLISFALLAVLLYVLCKRSAFCHSVHFIEIDFIHQNLSGNEGIYFLPG